MSKEKYRMKSAVYLIPRRGDKVLLSLRENTGWMDGYYSLIAGHIEMGETAEQSMIREAKEEGDVEINESNLKFVHVQHRLGDDPADAYIDFYFQCTEWQGDFVNNEPEKSGGLGWFNISNLPENTLNYVKDVVRMVDENIYFSSRESII